MTEMKFKVFYTFCSQIVKGFLLICQWGSITHYRQKPWGGWALMLCRTKLEERSYTVELRITGLFLKLA